MKKKQTTVRVLSLVMALVLTLSMVLSLTACVGNSAPTEPPATNPPATEPPATNPPATEPPATNPPATEPPATEPPATEPEPTEEPTEAPTEAPTEEPTEEPTEAPTEAPTEEPTEAPTEPVVEVTFRDVDETVYATAAVNVRSGPGSDNTWLGSLSRGESVKRIGIGSNGWDKVVYNGETAYIFSDYLSLTKPADEPQPTEPPATNPPATNPPATEPPATEDDPYDFGGYTPATITWEVYSTWDRFKQMCFRNHFSSSVSSMTPEVRHNYDKATLYEGYTCTEHDDHCRDQYDHDRLMRNLATPCPYCGQLNCPSYLHVDPRDLYFETVKCEQYNELKDPMVYCQTCGKPLPYMGCDWTQVCCAYLADVVCPHCGVWTEARACHTCRQEDIDNHNKGN